MKTIHVENGIIIYYGNRVGRVSEGCAVVDPMFQGSELSGFLKKQRSIREIKWTDGMFDRLLGGPGGNSELPVLKNCRVWQLKPEVDIRMKFIGYEELCRDFGPPDPADYEMVFDGAVETNELVALYIRFSIDHLSGYSGHSLSMSDVLELYDEKGSTFHYIDRFGFQQVDFETPGQTMAQILTI